MLTHFIIGGVARTATTTKPYGARARPLPPEERRLAIVTTAIAVLRRDREMPSTRRLADECGIAEGTLFRAFPTKDDLVAAILSSVACPYPFRDSLRSLGTEDPPTADGLRTRLLAAARLLHRRFTDIFETLGPLRVIGPPHHGAHPGCPGPTAEPLSPQAFRDNFAGMLAPYVPLLRVDPDVLIDAVRYLAFAGSHEGISDGRFMSPESIVDLLVDGALRHPSAEPATGLSTGTSTSKDAPC